MELRLWFLVLVCENEIVGIVRRFGITCRICGHSSWAEVVSPRSMLPSAIGDICRVAGYHTIRSQGKRIWPRSDPTKNGERFQL